eukprot:m51a1_g7256 putative Sec39 domain (1944) ;mRNA; r:158701-165391
MATGTATLEQELVWGSPAPLARARSWLPWGALPPRSPAPFLRNACATSLRNACATSPPSSAPRRLALVVFSDGGLVRALVHGAGASPVREARVDGGAPGGLALAVARDGSAVAAAPRASQSPAVALLSRDLEPLAASPPCPSAIACLAFSPSGDVLAVCEDLAVRVVHSKESEGSAPDPVALAAPGLARAACACCECPADAAGHALVAAAGPCPGHHFCAALWSFPLAARGAERAASLLALVSPECGLWERWLGRPADPVCVAVARTPAGAPALAVVDGSGAAYALGDDGEYVQLADGAAASCAWLPGAELALSCAPGDVVLCAPGGGVVATAATPAAAGAVLAADGAGAVFAWDCGGGTLARVERLSAEEVVARRMAEGDFDAAADAARASGLSTDVVFEQRWLAHAVTQSTLAELAFVADKQWVARRCCERVGDTAEATRCMLRDHALALLGDRPDDAQLRAVALCRLARLDAMPAVWPGPYDPARFEWFADCDLVTLAADLAARAELAALGALVERLGPAVQGHALAVLDCAPLSAPPAALAGLLTWAMRDLGGAQALRDPRPLKNALRLACAEAPLSGDESELAVRASERSSEAAPVPRGRVAEWLRERALAIDDRTGLLDYSAEAATALAEACGVRAELADLAEAVAELSFVAYDKGDDSVRLRDYVAAEPLERLRVLTRGCTAATVVPVLAGPASALLVRDEELLAAFLEGEGDRNGLAFVAPAIRAGLVSAERAAQTFYACRRTDVADVMLEALGDARVEPVRSHIVAEQILRFYGVEMTLAAVAALGKDRERAEGVAARVVAQAVGDRQRRRVDRALEDLLAVQSRALAPALSEADCVRMVCEALLNAHDFKSAMEYLPRTKDAEALIVRVARAHIDKAQSLTDPNIAAAEECLWLSLEPTEELREERSFLKALREMDTMGVRPLVPSELRESLRSPSGRLDAVRAVLRCCPRMSSDCPRVLALAAMLPPFPMQGRDAREVQAVVARAAMAAGDVGAATAVCTQLVAEAHAPVWDLCRDIVRSGRAQLQPADRVRLLAHCVAFCDACELPALLAEWRAAVDAERAARPPAPLSLAPPRLAFDGELPAGSGPGCCQRSPALSAPAASLDACALARAAIDAAPVDAAIALALVAGAALADELPARDLIAEHVARACAAPPEPAAPDAWVRLFSAAYARESAAAGSVSAVTAAATDAQIDAAVGADSLYAREIRRLRGMPALAQSAAGVPGDVDAARFCLDAAYRRAALAGGAHSADAEAVLEAQRTAAGALGDGAAAELAIDHVCWVVSEFGGSLHEAQQLVARQQDALLAEPVRALDALAALLPRLPGANHTRVQFYVALVLKCAAALGGGPGEPSRLCECSREAQALVALAPSHAKLLQRLPSVAPGADFVALVDAAADPLAALAPSLGAASTAAAVASLCRQLPLINASRGPGAVPLTASALHLRWLECCARAPGAADERLSQADILRKLSPLDASSLASTIFQKGTAGVTPLVRGQRGSEGSAIRKSFLDLESKTRVVAAIASVVDEAPQSDEQQRAAEAVALIRACLDAVRVFAGLLPQRLRGAAAAMLADADPEEFLALVDDAVREGVAAAAVHAFGSAVAWPASPADALQLWPSLCRAALEAGDDALVDAVLRSVAPPDPWDLDDASGGGGDAAREGDAFAAAARDAVVACARELLSRGRSARACGSVLAALTGQSPTAASAGPVARARAIVAQAWGADAAQSALPPADAQPAAADVCACVARLLALGAGPEQCRLAVHVADALAGDAADAAMGPCWSALCAALVDAGLAREAVALRERRTATAEADAALLRRLAGSSDALAYAMACRPGAAEPPPRDVGARVSLCPHGGGGDGGAEAAGAQDAELVRVAVRTGNAAALPAASPRALAQHARAAEQQLRGAGMVAHAVALARRGQHALARTTEALFSNAD